MTRAALAFALACPCLPAAAQTGRPFTLEDLGDLAEYLNRTHYRLTK